MFFFFHLSVFIFFVQLAGDHRYSLVLTHSFPTQRSSDLAIERLVRTIGRHVVIAAEQRDAKVGNFHPVAPNPLAARWQLRQNSPVRSDGDRKSTRLNSSHYCASRMPSSA